jgi:hypothetical protein
VLCFGISSSQATGYGLGPASSCRVPALDVGPKNDSTNDRSTSPLEEQVCGVIPLVPLFTVSFQYYYSIVHIYFLLFAD